MTNVPIVSSDFQRRVSNSANLLLKNRFVERNPSLSDEPVAAISRPGMRRFAQIGDGPIRKLFSSPGTFDDDLFAVSGDTLFRISSADLSPTSVGDISTGSTSAVSMAATAPLEGIPNYLFITEGGVLWLYTDNGHSIGHLQVSGAIANGDVIRIDTVYYQWTSGSVDTGAPAGTVGNPWLVALGGTNTVAMTNMYNAIKDIGAPGTDYSTALTAHPTVQPTNYNATDLYVEAIVPGTAGDSIVTTETGANTAWTSATLEDGGESQLRQVQLPDDIGAISVAHINSYIIVVPIQEDELKGRFYWIEPGETTIDPLNFATAERAPDGVHQVIVFGDMFWLLGQSTTEPWITTGNPDAPMERYKGILFDRGSWAGTAVQVKDSFIVADEDGAVFQLSGKQNRISNPSIEERIRRAIQLQNV